MMKQGYLVLESGEVFPGCWLGGKAKAGEVVFNTSHSGYEEIATDPSYYSQILVTTSPMQGNYGADDLAWESSRLSIHGFVCLEMQNSFRDNSWKEKLVSHDIPVMDEVDTRRLVICLREKGTLWGAVLLAETEQEAVEESRVLIKKQKSCDRDWAFQVSRFEPEEMEGELDRGPRVAVLDFGCKTHLLRELKKRCSMLKIFPSRSTTEEVRGWRPNGIMLSNGPGDPSEVQVAVDTVRQLLGWRFIFGICMGHQILSLALGAKTYKLKFGHRGSNHPIRDDLQNKVYMTSQNHGYAVEESSLPEGVKVTHVNLNDNTVSGIQCIEKKCLSVQFHPESHPGPHDSVVLFDYFVKQLL